MGAAAAGMQLVGSAVNAAGQIEAGNAANKADQYNADIVSENAELAKQSANYVGAEGDIAAGIQGLKTRSQIGSIKANQAAGNIDVNKGSAVDVRGSQEAAGMFDAMTIRSNAARKAYGFETQANSDIAQSQLDIAAGKQSQKAAEIGAAGTLLSGTGSGASNYAKWQLSTNPMNSDGL